MFQWDHLRHRDWNKIWSQCWSVDSVARCQPLYSYKHSWPPAGTTIAETPPAYLKTVFELKDIKLDCCQYYIVNSSRGCWFNILEISELVLNMGLFTMISTFCLTLNGSLDWYFGTLLDAVGFSLLLNLFGSKSQ